MAGDDVRKIQEALVKANISVTIDGVFGTDTESAIKQFQQQKGLTPDGIVDTATRLELGL
jgi:peptidoglycan hydrolase-like protein with peptidoglycan-binding domain